MKKVNIYELILDECKQDLDTDPVFKIQTSGSGSFCRKWTGSATRVSVSRIILGTRIRICIRYSCNIQLSCSCYIQLSKTVPVIFTCQRLFLLFSPVKDCSCYIHLSDCSCYIHLSDCSCYIHLSDCSCYIHLSKDRSCYIPLSKSVPLSYIYSPVKDCSFYIFTCQRLFHLYIHLSKTVPFIYSPVKDCSCYIFTCQRLSLLYSPVKDCSCYIHL